MNHELSRGKFAKSDQRDRITRKLESIQLAKSTKIYNNRKEKRQFKHSESFLTAFDFFLSSYRADILTFPGTIPPKIVFDINSVDAKIGFKKFDNGEYKSLLLSGLPIPSKQPNILHAVIVAKKSLGLHIKMWSEGISEQTFTMEEIIEDFTRVHIEIPKCFLTDFENTVNKMIKKRYNL